MTDRHHQHHQSHFEVFGGGDPALRGGDATPPPRIRKVSSVRITVPDPTDPNPSATRRVLAGHLGPVPSRDTVGFVKQAADRAKHHIRLVDGWAVSEAALQKATDAGATLVLVPVPDEEVALEFGLDDFSKTVPVKVRGELNHKLDPQRYAPDTAARRWPLKTPTDLYLPARGAE